MTRTITREELRIKLSSTDRPVLFEALPEKYYAAKHLPGALHLPHNQVDALAPGVLPQKHAPVVVYCALGHEVSQGAAASLRRVRQELRARQHQRGRDE